jgi:hypothetical protein
MMQFAAMHESLVGTFRTWHSHSAMSVQRSKAEIVPDRAEV